LEPGRGKGNQAATSKLNVRATKGFNKSKRSTSTHKKGEERGCTVGKDTPTRTEIKEEHFKQIDEGG